MQVSLFTSSQLLASFKQLILTYPNCKTQFNIVKFATKTQNWYTSFVKHILFIFFLLVTSTLFALLEIQIEGKNGWAAALPTWKKPVNKKGFLRFLSDPNQPQTGYHTYLWAFLFTISHLVFLLTDWTIQKEIYVISYYILLTTVEDFLWFVFNPHYGTKKFKKGLVPWHTNWFLGIPRNYWISYPLGIFLYLVGSGVIQLFAF